MKYTGGLSEMKKSDDEINNIISDLSECILNKLNLSDKSIIGVCSYKTQVVAGIIYYTKVNISNNHYHLKIINYLPHENKGNDLISIKSDETDNSEIKYF